MNRLRLWQEGEQLLVGECFPVRWAWPQAPAVARRREDQSGLVRLRKYFPVERQLQGPRRFVVDLPLGPDVVDDQARSELRRGPVEHLARRLRAQHSAWFRWDEAAGLDQRRGD